MKKTIITAESATNITAETAAATILATFNETIVEPYSLLKNMQVVKNAVPKDDIFQHNAFNALLEILQESLQICEGDFNNNPPAWAKVRLEAIYKGASTVACMLCDKKGTIKSSVAITFIENVISLLYAETDTLISVLAK